MGDAADPVVGKTVGLILMVLLGLVLARAERRSQLDGQRHSADSVRAKAVAWTVFLLGTALVAGGLLVARPSTTSVGFLAFLASVVLVVAVVLLWRRPRDR